MKVNKKRISVTFVATIQVQLGEFASPIPTNMPVLTLHIPYNISYILVLISNW